MENSNENMITAVEPSQQVATLDTPTVLPSEVNTTEVASNSMEPSMVEASSVEPVAITEVIMPSEVMPNAVEPSCGCDEKKYDHQLVYALGTIGVDFGTDAILDSFKFYMRGIKDEDGKAIQYPDPYNPKHLLTYLEGGEGGTGAHMYDSLRAIWTVSQNGTPIYAIKPTGSFSELTYTRLVEFLRPYDDKDNHNVSRIDLCSFPGYVTGSIKLRSGQVVPVITPNMRAMYNWRTIDLVKIVAEKLEGSEGEAKTEEDILNMVERVANKLTFQLQNFGTSSADRALNHTATNLYNVGQIIALKLQQGYELDRIRVEKSSICRPDSDCQDVLFTFFNPTKRLEMAKHTYRFTADVSKVIPVSIGTVRDWFEY
ncbi:MAG: hypothetical protein ACRBFS_17100 [Aureispira sp.]